MTGLEPHPSRRIDVVGRLTLPVPPWGRPALRLVEALPADADDKARRRHRARHVAAEVGCCSECGAYRDLRPARVGVLVVIHHRPGCVVSEGVA